MEADHETKKHQVLKSDEEGSRNIHELPSCVMMEILSRLPLKTVFNSRCVCKLWKDYFSDPYFSAIYAANGPTQLIIPIDHRNSNTVYIVDCDSQDCSARKINFGVSGNRGLPLMLTEKHTAIRVASFCNGFLSLCEKESGNPVSLWNPMLREYVFLPEATRASPHLSGVISGLGFADKKYKVVRIYKAKSTEALWEAEMTTVGTDTNWRTIGKVPYELSVRFRSTNFNGVLHWTTEGQASELIYCLDVRNEKFSCLPPPPMFSPPNKNRRDHYWSNIGVFEDSLYISAIGASDLIPTIQVWMMKEYGFKESWIRFLNIKSPLIDLWKRYRRFELINVLSDGNIVLLWSDDSLLVCNPRNQSYRRVSWRKKLVIAVSPSFVSLKDVASEIYRDFVTL